jgi:endogenous inhibitor of DNA gyrase (YacG/DUF329 family)
MPPVAEPPKDTGQDAGGGTGQGTGTGPKPKPCPICGKPAAQAFLPFCSSRCRDVDLNRWLKGSYVVPGSDEDEEDPG